MHHSINTVNLQGMGHEHHGDNHAANAILEDLFVRKFVKGVFWRSHIPEKGIGIIRRLNEIEVITTVTIVSKYHSLLFKGGKGLTVPQSFYCPPIYCQIFHPDTNLLTNTTVLHLRHQLSCTKVSCTVFCSSDKARKMQTHEFQHVN